MTTVNASTSLSGSSMVGRLQSAIGNASTGSMRSRARNSCRAVSSGNDCGTDAAKSSYHLRERIGWMSASNTVSGLGSLAKVVRITNSVCCGAFRCTKESITAWNIRYFTRTASHVCSEYSIRPRTAARTVVSTDCPLGGTRLLRRATAVMPAGGGEDGGGTTRRRTNGGSGTRRWSTRSPPRIPRRFDANFLLLLTPACLTDR